MSDTATPTRPPFRAALDSIRAYQAGMSLEEAGRRYGRSDFVKLASNENLFGPSPKVYEAVRQATQIELYPDPYAEALRTALAGRIGVDMDRIIMGAGSETLVELLMRAAMEAGDVLQLSSPTFPLYGLVAGAMGLKVRDVPRLPNFDLDVAATIAALQDSPPRLLIICTPNNPTGNAISDGELEQVLAATSKDTVVLYDEAYYEYNDPSEALARLDAWGGPYLLTRTFSKAYGLASMRVGYGIASSAELVGYLDRIRPAFNITSLSQAGALAALNDTAHLRHVVDTTRSERARIEQALDGLQIRHAPSMANFVLVESRKPFAEAADRLLKDGVIVRPIPIGENGWLRITIGRPQDNDRMLAALPDAIR
jgi:histidinol-phosphate aminotransferase